jgi:hypothetical protein
VPLILPSTFVDNDVIWKACQFRLLVDLPQALGIAGEEMTVLGSLRYVIGPKVEASEVDETRQTFQEFLEAAEEIEPDEAELKFAAHIEEAALRMSVAIDGGESLLVAVALNRGARHFVSGDKRAIKGLSILATNDAKLRELAGYIVTLEQVAFSIAQLKGCDAVRSAVCALPKVDRALAACFMCHQPECSIEGVRDALSSYQRQLSKDTNGFVKDDLFFAA